MIKILKLLIKLRKENRALRQCVNHYAENGYSKAIKCLKELDNGR